MYNIFIWFLHTRVHCSLDQFALSRLNAYCGCLTKIQVWKYAWMNWSWHLFIIMFSLTGKKLIFELKQSNVQCGIKLYAKTNECMRLLRAYGALLIMSYPKRHYVRSNENALILSIFELFLMALDESVVWLLVVYKFF